MGCHEVEGVACELEAGVVGEAAAAAGIVVIGPWNSLLEEIYLAGVADFLAPGHSGVQGIHEAAVAGEIYPHGGRNTGEVVHHHHVMAVSFLRNAYAQHFRGEAPAAFILRRNAETVEPALLDGHFGGAHAAVLFDFQLLAGVKGSIVLTCIQDVAACPCSGFKRVIHCFPAELHLAA